MSALKILAYSSYMPEKHQTQGRCYCNASKWLKTNAVELGLIILLKGYFNFFRCEIRKSVFYYLSFKLASPSPAWNLDWSNLQYKKQLEKRLYIFWDIFCLAFQSNWARSKYQQCDTFFSPTIPLRLGKSYTCRKYHGQPTILYYQSQGIKCLVNQLQFQIQNPAS